MSQTMESLTEAQRELLTRPVWRWLARLSDEHQDALVREIADTFYAWQSRQADSAGRVAVYGRPVTLREAVARSRTIKSVPVADATPWECAGPHITDELGLAVKLWTEEYPAFSHLISTHGLGTIFSLIGSWSIGTAAPASLIDLNALLVSLMEWELEHARLVGSRAFQRASAAKLKAQERMIRAQRLGAKKSHDDAIELHQKINTMADEYKDAHPHADRVAVLDYLETRVTEMTRGTMSRVVGDVMQRARKRAKQRLVSQRKPGDLYR